MKNLPFDSSTLDTVVLLTLVTKTMTEYAA